MTTAIVTYQGGLRTKSVHVDSQQEIITDAPKDNEGNGMAFSPTDLLSSALASCMLTIMGIIANRHQLNIEGTTAQVTKIMGNNPRRVIEIVVNVKFNQDFDTKNRILLENAALTCPVAESLHPAIKQTISFAYGH